MIPYFVVALILFFLGIFEITNSLNLHLKKILVFFTGIVILLFSSMAVSRGDPIAYKEIFLNPDRFYYIEKGYLLLNRFVFEVGGDLLLLFLIIGSINIFSKLYFFTKLSDYFFISIFVLFTTTFITQEMGALRFSIGTSLFLIAVINLIERKKKLFFIFIIIGSFFHMSILIGIVLYPVRNLKISRKLIFISVLLLFVTYLIKIDVLSSILKIATYISPLYGSKAYGYYTISERAGLEFGFLKRLCLMIFLLFVSKKQQSFNPLIINIYFLSIITYLLFAPVNVIAQRFSIFFGSVEPIIIGYIIISFKEKQRLSVYLITAIVYFFTLYRTLLIYTDQVNTWVPYKTFYQ